MLSSAVGRAPGERSYSSHVADKLFQPVDGVWASLADVDAETMLVQKLEDYHGESLQGLYRSSLSRDSVPRYVMLCFA